MARVGTFEFGVGLGPQSANSASQSAASTAVLSLQTRKRAAYRMQNQSIRFSSEHF